MGSSVSVRHAKPANLIQLWLGTYATVSLDAENTGPPGGRLRCRPERGRLTRVNDDGYLTGPSELMVKVAASSTIDLRCCLSPGGIDAERSANWKAV